MSDSIAATSATIIAMAADRRPRREPRHRATPQSTRSTDSDAAAPAISAPSLDSPPPASDLSGELFAETLFAASMLADQIRILQNQLDALRRSPAREWAPPESALRLRDKTV